MKEFLGYLATPVFYFYYAFILIAFHPVQVGAHYLFGDNARNRVVNLFNFLLVKGLYIMGCKVSFRGFEKVPSGRPLIIVANHQSMYDIPAVVWGFRRFRPKFISKIELSKNLPSISYNLKHGKSALIDRNNKSQAVKEIFRLGKLIQENNYAACIFPEGTRSKTGKVREFMSAGIGTLLRAAPDSLLVPFVIDGHSGLMSKGKFPLKFGQNISYTVLEPLKPGSLSPEELTKHLEMIIKKELNQ